MVPFNHRGLFDAMGGDRAVVRRLDDFTQQLNAGPAAPYAYLGNEPTLNTPWAYDYAGRPDRTADVVRRAVTTLFGDGPDGEVGNDDLGELSSWAVWASLGLYPQVPGRADLVLAGPLFPRTTITRGNGTVIEISAPAASADARYVHGLRVDGHTTTRPWVDAGLITHGGSLAYQLTADPDSDWSRDPRDAPPSFDVGPAHPLTGEVTGAADKCLDVDRSGTTDGTPVQLWTCNGTGAQQWWPRPDGSLYNPPSARCLDLQSGRTDNGTELQLRNCNGQDRQHWRMPR